MIVVAVKEGENIERALKHKLQKSPLTKVSGDFFCNYSNAFIFLENNITLRYTIRMSF